MSFEIEERFNVKINEKCKRYLVQQMIYLVDPRFSKLDELPVDDQHGHLRDTTVLRTATHEPKLDIPLLAPTIYNVTYMYLPTTCL
jgi:hypothetical protein